MNDPVSICVVGSGYVGLVAAVCFAEIGHTVICVDKDEAKIALLRSGGVPIFEQHLPALLKKHRGRGVTFTTDLREAVAPSQAVFIAVGTPQGETGAADLSYVEAVVTEIARHLSGYKVIVEKSTPSRCTPTSGFAACSTVTASIPTTSTWPPIPSSCARAARSWISLHPDRIVVGADPGRPADLLRRIYAPLTEGSYYSQPGALHGPRSAARPAPLLVTSAQSAEILKHASNAFLALKISFINAVANLAESVDADIEDIAAGMGMDSRIGPSFLRAGLGYGGSCFPKDVAAFHFVAQQRGLSFPLLEEVRRINDAQRDVFFNKIRSALWTLRGKKLAVLGLAFKGGTDDIRRLPRHRYHQALAPRRRQCIRLRSRSHRARPRDHAAL